MRSALLAVLLAAGILAGCTEPQEAAAAPAPTVPEPEEEPVDWMATMSSTYCTTAGGVRACGSGIGVGSGSGSEPNPTYIHDADGRALVAGVLTLEWAAASPTTENLRLAVFAMSGCPDECETNRSLASEIGPSPLTVQVPSLAAGEGLSIAARVEVVDFAQGTQASIGQDLHLSGSLTFLEPADPMDGGAADPDPDDDAP